MTTEHNESISLIDENGNETLYNVYYTFHSDEFNKDYVFLYEAGTDNSEDEDVDLIAYAFVANEDGEEGTLEQIESEEEWAYLEQILDELDESEE